MDGNPLPKPVRVPGLWLGTAERVSAIVEMNHPGVWIMGERGVHRAFSGVLQAFYSSCGREKVHIHVSAPAEGGFKFRRLYT
jgi:FtsP/CotA-like multicopper oxidase with cupredoxin domain